MKKILFLGIGSLLVMNLLAQKATINDPNAEMRPVKGFHAIEVSSAIDLYLSQGDEEAMAVSARDIKWRNRIRTEVVDGVLKISLDNGGFSWTTGNKQLKAYVSFNNLDHLHASGASDVFVNGMISGDKLEMHLSGASDFKGGVKLNELTLVQSGASDVQITGSVGSLTVHASGASDVKGYDLVTENCTANATGASDIHITVNKELSARASGASSVVYKGSAVVKEMRSHGASSVSKRD